MAQHIRVRRGRYLVQIRVPRDLEHRYPAQFVERYLGTGDLREAKDRAPAEVAAIRAEFKARRDGVEPAVLPSMLAHIFDSFRARTFNALAEGEVAIAGALSSALTEGDVAAVLKSYGVVPDDNMVHAVAIMIAGGRTAGVSRIETHAGPPSPVKPWRRPVATGETVESATHLDEYLATLADRNERKSIDMKRSTITKFCAEFPSLSDVDRQRVQQWLNRQSQAGVAVATIRRALSEMRGYWRYLRSIQKVADDSEPFNKLDVAKNGGRVKREDRRQPFTAGDVLKLLAGAKEDTELADLIEIGRWTGARIEEICSLRVENVKLAAKVPHFTVHAGKSDAAIREVPVHSDLKPVLRRLIGKRTNGFVLSGLTPNKYGDRSAAIGKRFGKLKRTLDFGEDQVFHSIRKTVATLLEDAGVSENVAADILGHEKPRITYGLYSGGASLATKAQAIEKLGYGKESAQ